MSASSGLNAGEVIAGRYSVERLIGKGGMGAVYAARNQNSGRKVALKVIKAGLEETPEQRRRFLREAKAATAIQHPNVIEVLDVFEEDDGTLVMVMELLSGETLKDFRARAGAVTLHEAAKIFLPIADALRTAHDKGIVHRDLKPENVFLADKGGERIPTILDFGIAKVLDPTTLSAETQGQETATGSLLGTPHYMSYEQAMSDKLIDHRADVWAVGVMLFELITGRRPIEFENLGEMYTAFITGTIPSIRDCVPDLPAAAGQAIDRCLVKEREGRLESLVPLVDMLRRYAEPDVEGGNAGGRIVTELPRRSGAARAPEAVSSTAGGQAVTAVEPRPARWPWLGAALAVAMGIGATAFYAARPATEPETATEPSLDAALGASAAVTSEPSAPREPAVEAEGAGAGETAAPPEPPPTVTPGSPPPKVNVAPAKLEERKEQPPQPEPEPEPRKPGLAEENPYPD
jgi:eukaryotic-like serine/threonine-protein kinase